MTPLLNKRINSNKINNRNNLTNPLGNFGQLSQLTNLSQLNQLAGLANSSLNNLRKQVAVGGQLVGSSLLQQVPNEQKQTPLQLNNNSSSRPASRKWEQKQVQIKTLEGEFSVTMWAAGAEDGMCASIMTDWNRLRSIVLID